MLIIGIQKKHLKTLMIKTSVIIAICISEVIHYYLQMYLTTLEVNAL